MDVKISAWFPIFLTTLNLLPSPENFTVIFVCIYLRAFFKKKKEKEKYDCLIFEVKQLWVHLWILLFLTLVICITGASQMAQW